MSRELFDVNQVSDQATTTQQPVEGLGNLLVQGIPRFVHVLTGDVAHGVLHMF
jgi:hypothetical protein